MPESELLEVGIRGEEANVAGHLRDLRIGRTTSIPQIQWAFRPCQGGTEATQRDSLSPITWGCGGRPMCKTTIFITRRNQVEDSGIGRMLSTSGSGCSLRCVQD